MFARPSQTAKAATVRSRILRILRVCLGLNTALDGALEIIQGEGGFRFRNRFLIGAELAYVGQRLPFARQQCITASLILLHPEPPMLNPNKGNELAAIVLDEKNIVITHLKLRRVGYFHRPAVHRTSQHSDRVVRARATFQRIDYFERDKRDNAMLSAFTDPLRLQSSDFAFENDLSATNQLIKFGGMTVVA